MTYHVKDINTEQQFHSFVENIKKISDGSNYLTNKLNETGKFDGRIVKVLKEFAINVLHINVTTTSKKEVANSIRQFVKDNQKKFEIKQSDLDTLMGVLKKLEDSEKNKKVFKKAIRTLKKTKSPLTYAILEHNAKEVLKLTQGGANTDIPDASGALPLHWAAMCGNLEAVESLCTPENINAATEKGLTPLFLGLKSRNTKLIKFLLDKGADSKIKDKRGNLPIHYLTATKDLDLFKMLYTQDIKDVVGEHGRSLLSSAVLSDNNELVDFLLAEGADPEKRDQDKKSILDHAFERMHETGNTKMVSLLLAKSKSQPR